MQIASASPGRNSSSPEPRTTGECFDAIELILHGVREDLDLEDFGNISFNMGAAARLAVEGVALLGEQHATPEVATLAGDLTISVANAARSAAMTQAFAELRADTPRADRLVRALTPMVGQQIEQAQVALSRLRQHVSR